MAHRRRSSLALGVTGILLLAAALRPSDAHILLDGEVAQAFLLDIASCLKETKGGSTEEARSEGLYLLGEKVQGLVELMNMDLMSHGKSLYAELIAKRLQEYGIGITLVERRRQYVYDLAAFLEYLKRAPRGKRAADVGFRLIAEAFYRSVGKDAAELVDTDVEWLRTAIIQEEIFLKEYPGYEKIREIRFFLAMDYYRMHRNSPDPATAKEYETLSSRALQEIVKEYPGSAEARAATITLERLQRAGQNK